MQSANVQLRRYSEEPLRIIRKRYGSPEQLEAVLEAYVLAAEGRARRAESLPAQSTETKTTVAGVATLLDLITAYGSLGVMGHADQKVNDSLLPLLTRLVKTALRGGFAMDEDEGEGESSCAAEFVDADVLVEKASKAISNCTRGVTCREADCVFEVNLPSDKEPQMLSVCFGFADYSASETGAMLWAGAVGLSLFLIEHGERYLWRGPSSTAPLNRHCQRMIEIGCGPGLVSLVVADLYVKRVRALRGSRGNAVSVPDLHLDVTDISPSVVREVQQSFSERNSFADCKEVDFTVAGGGHGDSGGTRPSTATAGTTRTRQRADGKPVLQVNPFCFDFSSAQSAAMKGSYDIVLASDVVYDYQIAQFVAPAVECLLKPGGVAILCCESHRDGMQCFVRRLRDRETTSQLDVMVEEYDVQTLLDTLELPSGLTPAACSLIILRKIAKVS